MAIDVRFGSKGLLLTLYDSARIGDAGLAGAMPCIFRLRGDRRFDCVGAGGCAAVSATQGVMRRSSADVRFRDKSVCSSNQTFSSEAGDGYPLHKTIPSAA